MNEVHLAPPPRAEFTSDVDRLPALRPAASDGRRAVLATPATAEGHWGGFELIDRFAEEWRALCDGGPTDEPFYRPEWVKAYVRAFAPGQRLLLVTARIGGRLQAVLPLVEERHTMAGLPVRVLRSAANVHSSRFDLVRGPGLEGDAATRAVWQFLRACPGWDKLEFHYVPPGAALERLVSSAAADGFPTERVESWNTPYIPLRNEDGTARSGLEGTNAKFRANVRRRMRQLAAQGTLVLRRYVTADAAVLRAFYDLERAGWKGQEGSAISCHPESRQFYDEVAEQAARFGYFSLYLLELEGRAVAAQFGLTHRGRYFLPKPAYDESYSRFAPGQLLMHEMLADCVQRGGREVDFLGPSADWKSDWTSEVRPHSVWCVFHDRFRGRALHVATFSIKPALKMLLVRPRGTR